MFVCLKTNLRERSEYWSKQLQGWLSSCFMLVPTSTKKRNSTLQKQPVCLCVHMNVCVCVFMCMCVVYWLHLVMKDVQLVSWKCSVYIFSSFLEICLSKYRQFIESEADSYLFIITSDDGWNKRSFEGRGYLNHFTLHKSNSQNHSFTPFWDHPPHSLLCVLCVCAYCVSVPVYVHM